MIDLIYKTLLTILNKENNGYVSPTEFNLLANNVQQEIFRGYFEDYNKDKNRENKGNTNRGYGNLPANERERIEQFAVPPTTIPINGNLFTLPEDFYYMEDEGVVTGGDETYPSVLVDKVDRGKINTLKKSLAKPTLLYPVYERYENKLLIYPSSIEEIVIRYLRQPKFPNWTYFMLPNGQPMYNPADTSFQDFELHPSEFSNIVLKMLSYFGINLRENEVVQIAEILKDKMNIKDSN